MKVVQNIKTEILLSELTQEHLIVGRSSNGEPVILSHGKWLKNIWKGGIFYLISGLESITQGNGHRFSGKANSLQEFVEEALHFGWEIQAFKPENWKEALKWLIDNV